MNLSQEVINRVVSPRTISPSIMESERSYRLDSQTSSKSRTKSQKNRDVLKLMRKLKKPKQMDFE
jgi:hypothetical protein